MATQLAEPQVDPQFAKVAQAMNAKKEPEAPLISRENFYEKFTGKPAPEEKPIAEVTPHPEDKAKPELQQKPEEKRQPFQKVQAETRRKLEEENHRLKEELETFKTKELPTLNTQIEELKKQIGSADTLKEAETLKAKLAEYEQTLNGVTEEKKKLAEKVEIFDFQNSERFQKEFVAPLSHTYSEVLESLYGNPEATTELQKAIVANEAYLSATDPAEKQRQFAMRNEILGGIRDVLSPYMATSFDMSTSRLWELAKKRNEAILTQQQIRQKWELEAKESNHTFQQRWIKAYEGAEKEVKVEYPETIAKIIKDKKIDDNNEADAAIADDLIRGGTRYTPEEYSRVIQQGKNYRRVQAQLQAKDELIKELESNIAALQGTGTQNGDSPHVNGNGNGTAQRPGFEAFKKKYGFR